MVVMLLQQHIPPLASQTPCPGPSHPPLGSSEKAVKQVPTVPGGAEPAGLRPRPAPDDAGPTGRPVGPTRHAAAAAAPPPPPPPAPRPAPAHPLHYDTRAMQYYRLWIYTCNGLLLVCVLCFAVTACHTVVFDQRRNLVPGLSLLQPTFLYGYLAVLSQSGFIQMIGCLGARRLNQKLLNVYWLLLLLLLFGDAMVGVVWLFRFESICEELRPWLRQRLLQEYSADSAFTATWDAYQRDNRCCGVQGPADYTALNRSLGWLPESCCRPLPALMPRSAALRNFHYHGTTTSTPSTTTVGMEAEDEYHIFEPRSEDGRPGVVPDAADLYCGGPLHPPDSTPSTTSSSSVGSGGASGGGGGGGGGGSLSGVPAGGGRIITHPVKPTAPLTRFYITGCEVRLKAWLTSAADVLFIVGYCILGFVKVCFLGILRYEIKEMIQKIRMLQGELNAPQLSSPDQEGRKSPQPGTQQAARFSNNNGSVVTGRGASQQDDSPVIGSSRTPQERRGRADSGTTPLLLQPADSLQTTPLHHTPAGGSLGPERGSERGGPERGGPERGGPERGLDRGLDRVVPDRGGERAAETGAPQLVQHTPLLHHRHLHHHHHHHLSLQDGNDSDTNSHCALLIQDDAGGGGGGLAGLAAQHGQSEPKMARQGSNGNNNYELHELHELHDMNRVLLARHPAHRHRSDI